MKRENLEAYLTLAGSMIGAGAMNAQVTYTDFDPDIVLDLNNSPVTFNLDIDQNGNPDFQVYGIVTSTIYNYSYTSTTSYGGTYRSFSYSKIVGKRWQLKGSSSQAQVAYLSNFYTSRAKAFNSGDSISGQNTGFLQNEGGLYTYYFFQSSTNYGYSISATSYGEWLGLGNSLFAGVRLIKNGQPHFGWVRMTRNSVNQLTIHDMAINDNPNIAIAAGDTGFVNNVGLAELKPNLAKILRGTDKIIVQTNPRISDFKLSIFDISGKRIYEENGKPGERKEIGTNDWSQGTYVLLMETEKGRAFRRKIIHR